MREKLRGNNSPKLTKARKVKIDQVIDLYRGGPENLRGSWLACFQKVYPKQSASAARRSAYDAFHHEYTVKRLAEFAEKSAERADFNQDRILKEVAAIALFDPRKLFNDDGGPKQISELDDATAAAISTVKTVKLDKDVSVTEYKVNDKNQALEKLMRHLGLYQQDNEQQNTSLAAALEEGIKRVQRLGE